MAVTQQIARLPESLLLRCKTNVALFEALLSFELVPETDYLDLDWSPQGLERLVEESRQLPEVRLALSMALKGSALVHAEHRQGPSHDPVYSDVTMLYPSEVAQVAKGLGLFDQEAFLCWLPEDEKNAQQMLGIPFIKHPGNYYGKHLTALVNFYKQAAAKHLATAMWWD